MSGGMRRDESEGGLNDFVYWRTSCSPLVDIDSDLSDEEANAKRPQASAVAGMQKAGVAFPASPAPAPSPSHSPSPSPPSSLACKGGGADAGDDAVPQVPVDDKEGAGAGDGEPAAGGATARHHQEKEQEQKEGAAVRGGEAGPGRPIPPTAPAPAPSLSHHHEPLWMFIPMERTDPRDRAFTATRHALLQVQADARTAQRLSSQVAECATTPPLATPAPRVAPAAPAPAPVATSSSVRTASGARAGGEKARALPSSEDTAVFAASAMARLLGVPMGGGLQRLKAVAVWVSERAMATVLALVGMVWLLDALVRVLDVSLVFVLFVTSKMHARFPALAVPAVAFEGAVVWLRRALDSRANATARLLVCMSGSVLVTMYVNTYLMVFACALSVEMTAWAGRALMAAVVGHRPPRCVKMA